MKRRSLMQSLALLPMAAMPPAAPAQTPAPAADPLPKPTLSSAEALAQPVLKFFSRDQYEALAHLGDLLVPPANGNPGAREAEAALFLDFYLSQAPARQQTLYRQGLTTLMQRAGKPFAQLSVAEAGPLLAPLQAAWTYDGPRDPYAKFLLAAKEDFLQATLNSRAWWTSPARTRGQSATGYYWLPIE